MRTPALHLPFSFALHFHFPKTLLLMGTCLSFLAGGLTSLGETVKPPLPEQTLYYYPRIPVRQIPPRPHPASVKTLEKTNALRFSPQQLGVLKLAAKIGKQLKLGPKLAAVAFQESGLGLDPNSPAHYGVGSVGYSALQVVLHEHPRLVPYFQGRNWAATLVQDPRLSLWVAGYYLKHCYDMAHGNWSNALDLYRYGYGTPGPYVTRIQHRENQLRPYLEQL